MENATKALEMAASVLIGVLLIGCIVYMYTQVSAVKKIEQDSTRTEQASDFNKNFEAYNRDDLYGSDLFSLANQIENYNIKESDAKDYGRIDMKVNVKNKPIGAVDFTRDTYNAEDLRDAYNSLANKIRELENITTHGYGKNNNKKSVSYWANFGTGTRLEQQFAQECGKSAPNKLIDDVKKYTTYLGEQKDMARKTFKCTKMEYYSNTGRVKYMEFEEI